jgi:hypothetical protein
MARARYTDHVPVASARRLRERGELDREPRREQPAPLYPTAGDKAAGCRCARAVDIRAGRAVELAKPMLRTAPAAMLAAISLLGLTASGCEKKAKAPFYVPTSPTSERDASPDDDAGESPEHAPRHVGCDDGPELHVLFIGNSHTFTNDLPSIMRDFACAMGTKIVSQQSTPGGVGFMEHSTNPDTLAAIKAAAWDIVIMQDQQQRPGYRLDEVERDHLPAAQILVDAIRANRKRTRPIFYMVWSRRGGDMDNCQYYPLLCSFEGATQAIADGYRLYAERTESELAPVALAWAAIQADHKSPIPGDQLWMADGSHPTLPGSYLAAAVLLRTMLRTQTADVEYDGGLDTPVATYLQHIADRIVAEYDADMRVTTYERVRIECAYTGACTDDADASAVTFTLSKGSCKDLSAGRADVLARLPTHASCRNRECTSVALGEWHDVQGGAIADGTYQVFAHVDVNGNGDVDDGDLQACETGNFVVGQGMDLTFTDLDVR